MARLEARGKGHGLVPAGQVPLAEEEEARPQRMHPEEKQVLPGPALQLWPLRGARHHPGN